VYVLSTLLRVYRMVDKVKTSIVVDRRLWEEFKLKVGGEKGLRMLSKAVEEAVEEEVSELLVIKALNKMLENEEISLTVVPVKPKVRTDAGKTVREMRETRTLYGWYLSSLCCPSRA